MTGPYKIVLADSDLPSFPDLVDQIRAARATDRAVAVHCVTREALMLLLAALDEAGPPHPGDRIEHAAMIPSGTITELARRGLKIVTQPGFLADRGDGYLRDVPEPEDLYRLGTLMDAGVDVRLSSDAPYGPLDPWRVIQAAVQRQTLQGQIAGPAPPPTRGPPGYPDRRAPDHGLIKLTGRQSVPESQLRDFAGRPAGWSAQR